MNWLKYFDTEDLGKIDTSEYSRVRHAWNVTALPSEMQNQDLEGVTKVTSHPPLARQPISCYYYACDLSYFDVVLCPSSSQILATPLH